MLEELSRRSAVAMATGLFRQGPIEVVNERFRAIVFGGTGERARLSADLAGDLLKQGAKISWVGSSPLEGAISIHPPICQTIFCPYSRLSRSTCWRMILRKTPK